LAAREGGDHQFREADGEGAHRGGGDGGAAAAAEGNDAVDAAGGVERGDERGGGAGHERDAFAAVAAGEDGRTLFTQTREDFGAGDVGGDRRRVEAADVDQEGGEAGAAEGFGDVGVFGAFAIEGAEDCDGGHGDERRASAAVES
jgi:hypothetical protein